MRRLYEEYLHVPGEGKIREKVLISRVVVAVIGILVWMSAMGFTAYAYFTSSITSGSNTITAATYNTETIVVENKEGGIEEKLEELEPNTKASDMVRTFQLNSDENSAKEYNVEITATGSAQNGYCKIQILGADDKVIEEYYTISINQGSTLSFAIKCYESAKIRIVTNWGSCSVADSSKIIKQSDIITIGNATSLIEVPDNALESESQQTSETVTNPTTDSKTETSIGETGNQDSTSTSGEGTENSDSSGASPNDSMDDQDGDKATSDGVSNDTGDGESKESNGGTEQDGKVKE